MPTEWGDITAEEIVPSIRGKLISGDPGSVLTGLSTDSRQIRPGQLFLALKGERFDGHDFIEKAVNEGAVCIIAEKAAKFSLPANSEIAVIEVTDTLRALGELANWWRRRHDVIVVGITGSVGKTTTKEMTAHILEQGARTLKSEGNFNNLIGLPLTLLNLKEEDRRVVLEMGMNRPGEIGRLTEISEPDIGLITNVASAHLEGLGDVEGVARAKTELLEKISKKSRIVLYGDDELLMKEASRFGREAMTYGLGPGNDIRAAGIDNLGSGGISFELRFQGQSVPVRIRVPGMQNLINALAASSIAICMKEPVDLIVKGLARFEGINGRFKIIPLPGDIILVDDTYNANPYSLKAALHSIKDIAGNRRRMILGLGEMMELGDKTVSAHREAGEMIAEIGVSYLFVMGDHANEVITGAVKKGFPPKRTIETESHQEMADQIRDLITEGDLILLKGSRKAGLERVTQTLKAIWSKEDYHAKNEKDISG